MSWETALERNPIKIIKPETLAFMLVPRLSLKKPEIMLEKNKEIYDIGNIEGNDPGEKINLKQENGVTAEKTQ